MKRFIRSAVGLLLAAMTIIPLQGQAGAANNEKYPPRFKCLDVLQGSLDWVSEPGQLIFTAVLDAEPCADASYTLTVTSDNGTETAAMTRSGAAQVTGSAPVNLVGDEDGCAYVKVTTAMGPFGDAAPDGEPHLEDPAGVLCGGGGNSYN
jgi:hypothetical protein